VADFLNKIEDEQRRRDAFAIMAMMAEVTGDEPEMWGQDYVAFGRVPFRYADGRVSEWPRIGFAPRKQNVTLYFTCQMGDAERPLLDRLGKYKMGKSCLYLKRLSDVDADVLRQLIAATI
jgi:hypothetical protein